MQTRLQSFIESWANVLIGYGVALLTQIIVFPMFGMTVSLWQNIQISIIFTVVSLARSYFIRRLFNRLHKKSVLHMPPTVSTIDGRDRNRDAAL